MPKTLVITNDFPPRQGGIETFVFEVLKRLPASELVVYTSNEAGAAEFDATLDFPVIRDKSSTLLPTARVRDRAIALAREHGCDRVWFGAAAPLGLLAKPLHQAGIKRTVATTHGHEIWWARIPGARAALRRIGRDADIVTYLGAYTRSKIQPGLGKDAAMARLVPGADVEDFGGQLPPDQLAQLRAKYELEGKKVILCISRLVERKGQDTLIKALPQIQAIHPDAVLLIVGRGPYAKALHKLAAGKLAAGSADVIFAGGVPFPEIPALYNLGDVFAMPTRSRLWGLEAEGLGIVFLEASASRLPVIAGDSGGAPDTVLDGVTGYVVDGTDITGVAQKISAILSDPQARQMGIAGREWVAKEWSWEGSAQRLKRMLDPNIPITELVD